MEHLLSAALTGFGPPEAPQAAALSVGQVLGQVRSGLPQVPGSREEHRAGASASNSAPQPAGSAPLRSEGARLRSPAQGGAGRAAAPSTPNTKEGRAGTELGPAQACGRPSLRTRSWRSALPRAEWPRTLALEAGAPACLRMR